MGVTPSWLWVRWKKWGGGLNLVKSYVARLKVLGLNPAQSLSSTLAASRHSWISLCRRPTWHRDQGCQGLGRHQRGAREFSG